MKREANENAAGDKSFNWNKQWNVCFVPSVMLIRNIRIFLLLFVQRDGMRGMKVEMSRKINFHILNVVWRKKGKAEMKTFFLDVINFYDGNETHSHVNIEEKEQITNAFPTFLIETFFYPNKLGFSLFYSVIHSFILYGTLQFSIRKREEIFHFSFESSLTFFSFHNLKMDVSFGEAEVERTMEIKIKGKKRQTFHSTMSNVDDERKKCRQKWISVPSFPSFLPDADITLSYSTLKTKWKTK